MDTIETTILPLRLIESNNGQIDGLPSNPRILDADDYERLKKSVETNPEMLDLRELIVYPHNGKYVVIGGNMRLHILKALNRKEAPCKIIPDGISVDALRAIVIKDNVTYGDWADEMLRNDWKDQPLDDWGVHLADEIVTDEETKDADTHTLSLVFTPDQFNFIKQKLNGIDKDNAKAIIKLITDYVNQ